MSIERVRTVSDTVRTFDESTLVLGIETSCDETAAAVVESDETGTWRSRSSVVASQVQIHREWGGVVPELASRQHVRDICGVVERALSDARIAPPDLDAIAEFIRIYTTRHKRWRSP